MSMATDFEKALSLSFEQLPENEWALAELLDNQAESIEAHAAFDNIVSIVELASRQEEQSALITCCEFALLLADITNTTQHPPGLLQALSQLEQSAHNLGRVQEVNLLKSWYRIHVST